MSYIIQKTGVRNLFVVSLDRATFLPHRRPTHAHPKRRPKALSSDEIAQENLDRSDSLLRSLRSPFDGGNWREPNRLFANRAQQSPGALPRRFPQSRLLGVPSLRRASPLRDSGLCLGLGPVIQLGGLDGRRRIHCFNFG